MMKLSAMLWIEVTSRDILFQVVHYATKNGEVGCAKCRAYSGLFLITRRFGLGNKRL